MQSVVLSWRHFPREIREQGKKSLAKDLNLGPPLPPSIVYFTLGLGGSEPYLPSLRIFQPRPPTADLIPLTWAPGLDFGRVSL